MCHQSHNHCGVSPNTTPQNRAVLHTPGGLLVEKRGNPYNGQEETKNQLKVQDSF